MQRYSVVASVLVLVGFAILGKALYIMTVEKNYWMAVSERFVRENVPVEPTRGNILACNGEVLASSLPEYKMYMDFMSWEKDSVRKAKDQKRRDSMLIAPMIDSICLGMHSVFPDIDPVAFRKLLQEGREKKSHHWLLYNKRITYIQYKQVRSLPWFRMSKGRSGFHVDTFKTRKNPYGQLAIRTIGDLYKEKDSARTGLELSFDSILRGRPGVAHKQKVFNRYLSIVDRPAENGCDIVTTLDVNMQDICEKALSDKLTEIDANSGVCILMEVGTGDIKAMTSLSRCKDGVYREINADAVKNLYEPGSVFKPMSFLVGMDDGFIHMTDQVDVGCGIKEMYGRKMRDANWRSGGSGVVTVPQILQKSLNVGVSTLIDRYYHNDPRKFVEGIYRIGVAEDLHIPIPGYARPRIRMPKEDGSNWSKTALPWMSIGYETQIPPITTVNFYNGIANNGKLLRPRLVKAIMRGNEVVKEFPVVVLREHMAKPEAVKNIQDCLESVVSVGLGKKAGSKYFHTSGKTGTAQVWTKHGFASQYLVSFAGYFPSEQPLYSCIVCIQKGAPASGGGMCAPVFKRVAESIMAQRRVSDYSQARDTLHCLNPMVNAGNMNAAMNVLEALGIKYSSNINTEASTLTWGSCQTSNGGLNINSVQTESKNTVPDVRGYGLRDALFRLEKLGLKVAVHGVGQVSRQSMEPGHVFKPGELIEIYLGNATDVPKAAPDYAMNKAKPEDSQAQNTPDSMEQHMQSKHVPTAGQKIASSGTQPEPSKKPAQKSKKQPAPSAVPESEKKQKAQNTGNTKNKAGSSPKANTTSGTSKKQTAASGNAKGGKTPEKASSKTNGTASKSKSQTQKASSTSTKSQTAQPKSLQSKTKSPSAQSKASASKPKSQIAKAKQSSSKSKSKTA